MIIRHEWGSCLAANLYIAAWLAAQTGPAVEAYRFALREALAEIDRLRRQPVTRRSPESAACERAIYDLAIEIGRHWHDQEGVNGALLDELARLVDERGPR